MTAAPKTKAAAITVASRIRFTMDMRTQHDNRSGGVCQFVTGIESEGVTFDFGE